MNSPFSVVSHCRLVLEEGRDICSPDKGGARADTCALNLGNLLNAAIVSSIESNCCAISVVVEGMMQALWRGCREEVVGEFGCPSVKDGGNAEL